MIRLFLAALFTLWAGLASAGTLIMSGTNSGMTVSLTRIANAITTNTTSAASVLPPVFKTFWGQVVCSSGACAQTQEIYGDIDDDGTGGELLCTITLSGTTSARSTCGGAATTNYVYYYVVTTGTSGTGAAGAVYAIY
ncbi:MAG TPA: hypothetical protein VIR02_09535 [Anaerolineales bacterium]|jgi:hypothetical protein